MELREISVSKIKVGKYDLRLEKNDEEIADLAASLKRVGIIEPLVVSPKGKVFHLIAGHRRFRAAKEARLKKVPCVIEERKMTVQSEVAFAENFHRKDMSPIETAAMLAEYKNRHKLSVEEIAKIAHKTRQWVDRLLKIEDWPADVQMAVHKGQITVSAASNLAVIGDKTYRLFLLRNAVEQGATARTTAAWLQEYNSRQPMEKAIERGPAEAVATPTTLAPQAPCYICSQSFPANEVSHIPVCGACIQIIRKAGM